jgi:hypothetical protein
MTTLEQEIVGKFHQLDPAAQQRVRHVIEQESTIAEMNDMPPFDYEAWFQDMEVLRQEIKDTHEGIMPSIDVVSILRDILDGNNEK